jgi:integrase
LEGRKLRPSTRSRYQGLLNCHILPRFGELELGLVTTRAIRVWNSGLRVTHPDTAAQAYRLLATIYNTAVEEDLIGRSPCKVKGASQHRNPERPVATVREMAIASDAMDKQYRVSVPLACYCQLRRGEVLGLQRIHIDLEQATLRVEQTWRAAGGEMHLGPPKTDAGRRYVPIPSNVIPILSDHLERFAGDGPDGWLFPSANGSPVTARTLDRQWAIARKAIGRPELHFHDLRHTGLTLVAITGATTAEIMAAGGHDSPAAAIRYQHATMDGMTPIADALAAMAEGHIEPLSQTKGHARGTTPDGDVLDEDVSQPTLAVSEHATRKNSARRRRERRSKSPGQGTNSDQEPTSLASDDTDLNEASSESDEEQPQRDSNPCLHLERVVSSATRRWGPAPFSGLVILSGRWCPLSVRRWVGDLIPCVRRPHGHPSDVKGRARSTRTVRRSASRRRASHRVSAHAGAP